jgi:arginyl-tRNA synthetase
MTNELARAARNALEALYGVEVSEDNLLQRMQKEYNGCYTLVVFPFLKASGKSPAATAEETGARMKADNPALIADYSVVKGFLNLVVTDVFWQQTLKRIAASENYGHVAASAVSPLVMIEYSSPNTNKPLHLGHVRNNLLGYSLSEILKANGNRVVKTNIVNDRGIHICKSMLAWQRWGAGATPTSAGQKGDHLVGDYYVLFDRRYKAEIEALRSSGMSEAEAEASSELMCSARELLRKWEAGDEAVRSLWSMMNGWVYSGFDETYRRLGVDFDRIYYESETYLEGKATVLDGLERGVFVRSADGSVRADLTADGLDEKVLLRSDGTSVYITQDIGTAKLRFDDYPIDKMIYVVGNEQNYHFQVLSLLLERLGFSFGRGLVHFSYGMVELPDGKMKSREGTVVDADELMDEMIDAAREIAAESGKLDDLPADEVNDILRIIGLGSLKYFILKVDPIKNMTFNPKESIDFNGNTGSFIQYMYARIRSVLRKATEYERASLSEAPLHPREVTVIQILSEYPSTVREAGASYSPALIAAYVYELARAFNQFYHDCSILHEADAGIRERRLLISRLTADVSRRAMSLLGIEMPERM